MVILLTLSLPFVLLIPSCRLQTEENQVTAPHPSLTLDVDNLIVSLISVLDISFHSIRICLIELFVLD